jgi:glutamine synthetase type III
MAQEIMFENYVKTLTIEANTLVDMIDTGVLPAAAQDLAVGPVVRCYMKSLSSTLLEIQRLQACW